MNGKRGKIFCILTLLFLPLPAFAQNYHSGSAGNGVTLAVASPTARDLPAGQAWLPRYVQGMFTGNFNKFSAMTIIALQDRERVTAEQQLSLSPNYSSEELSRIGNLTNAQFILAGSVQGIAGARFNVQWSVTEIRGGVSRGSFAKTCGFAELRSAEVINEASAELLRLMGVTLTEAGRRELLRGSASATDAQAAQAKGIIAEEGGSAVEALSYFYLAASLDPSVAGNAERLVALSSQIAGGMGQNVRNAIAARNAWLVMLKDCAAFYRDHLPFDIVYDPLLNQAGGTDYGSAAANFDFAVELHPSEAAFKVMNDLLSGLEATGRRSLWDFAGWPLINGSKYPEPEAVMFGGTRSFRFTVAAVLIDASGRVIGRDSIVLNIGLSPFNSGDRSITPPPVANARPLFRRVNIQNYTPPLSVRLESVNGQSAESLNESGFMRVLTRAEYGAEYDTELRSRRGR
jgi:hypothetical protein